MADKPLCIVCGRRKASTFKDETTGKFRCCDKCATVTASEGTREKYGLPQPYNVIKSNVAFVAACNKMIVDGKTYQQIADTLGVRRQTLANRISALRKEGHLVELSRVQGAQPEEPQEPRVTVSPKANEHGGGKWGVTKCKCKLCQQKRRQARADWLKAHPGKQAEYNRRNEERKKLRRASISLRSSEEEQRTFNARVGIS